MKPKPNRSLILPRTPQREKTSGNHLLRRKKRTSLTSPIYMLFTSRSRFLTLSSRVSCINSLTSPTVLLWIIHDHSRKYLYQLSFTCEQKPIGRKQHLYERKSHQTKMAECSTNSYPGSRFIGKNVRLSSPPKEPFLKTLVA